MIDDIKESVSVKTLKKKKERKFFQSKKYI